MIIEIIDEEMVSLKDRRSDDVEIRWSETNIS